jgi:hypothetical protein
MTLLILLTLTVNCLDQLASAKLASAEGGKMDLKAYMRVCA